MTNHELLIKEVTSNGYIMGCYNPLINKLSKKEIAKVIDNLDNESTDIEVKIRNKVYVIELNTIDGEKDFNILSKDEYINRYGVGFFEDDE